MKGYDVEGLSLNFLSSCFRNVTNSYKFYWFWAILDELEAKDSCVLSMNELAIRMVSHVWYPLDYYKLSFGPADQFKEISRFLSEKMEIDHSPYSSDLFVQVKEQLNDQEQSVLYKKIRDLIRYVPYRFIRPFFKQELRGKTDGCINKEIQMLAASGFKGQKILYCFNTPVSIEIHPEWKYYLLANIGLIRKAIYWELLLFLQKNNPHVPGLSEKIFKPVSRSLHKAKMFWNVYREISGGLNCIYSGVQLTGTISLDHFVPWSYVVHDQIWNIVPTCRSVNSAKGNQLLSVKQYLPLLVNLHYQAFHAIYLSSDHRKEFLLEDYCLLFKESLPEIYALSCSKFGEYYYQTMVLMLQIAENMGFGSNWSYKSGP